MRIENNPVDYFLDAFEKCYPMVAAKIRGIYLDFNLVKWNITQSRTLYWEDGTMTIFVCPVTARGRTLSCGEIMEVLLEEFAHAVHGRKLDVRVLEKAKDEINDRIVKETAKMIK